MIAPPRTAFLSIVVPLAIPSQNTTNKWHWRQRHQETKTWEIYLRAAVKWTPVRPQGKVHVHIASYRTALIHDDSNYRGGAKQCVDALVRLGFLRDDSDKFARITYAQFQAPKGFRCTRITVTPAGAQ